MGGLLSNNSWKREESGSTPLRTSSLSSSTSSSPGWRQIVDDPRSPSAGIDRTPILVGRPEPETPPAPEVNLVDPRSPTVGITRTPLQLGGLPQDGTDKGAGEAAEVAAQTLEDRAADSKDSEDQGQQEESSEEDTKADTPDLQGLSLSDVDESSCLLPAAQQESRRPVVAWRTSTQSSLKPVVQPKQLFQCGDLSPILAAPSPAAPPQPRPFGLKPLDTNSPRALVQRKAIRKVEANRQNLPDQPTRGRVVDKENCW